MDRSEHIGITVAVIFFVAMLLYPLIGGTDPSIMDWLIIFAIALVVGGSAHSVIGVVQKLKGG